MPAERKTGTKFPWGDEAFRVDLLPPCFLFGAVITAAAICFPETSGPSTTAGGPVLVTLGWIHGYYNCIGAQLNVKMSSSADAQASLVAERSLMNTLEQGIPFLVLLWMHAALVDATISTAVGASYVVLRALYPVAYSYYGEFSMLCEIITQPNYMAIFFFNLSLLFYGCGWGSIFEVIGRNFFVWSAVLFVGNFVWLMVLWKFPTGQWASSYNLHYSALRAKAAAAGKQR